MIKKIDVSQSDFLPILIPMAPDSYRDGTIGWKIVSKTSQFSKKLLLDTVFL